MAIQSLSKGKISSALSPSHYVHVHDTGGILITSLAGDYVGLSDEAADRLLITLLARKAAKDHG